MHSQRNSNVKVSMIHGLWVPKGCSVLHSQEGSGGSAVGMPNRELKPTMERLRVAHKWGVMAASRLYSWPALRAVFASSLLCVSLGAPVLPDCGDRQLQWRSVAHFHSCPTPTSPQARKPTTAHCVQCSCCIVDPAAACVAPAACTPLVCTFLAASHAFAEGCEQPSATCQPH